MSGCHSKKQVAGSLFNKVVGHNFIKRRLQHRCLPVNCCKNFKSISFIDHQQQLIFVIAASEAGNILTFNMLVLAAFPKLLKRKSNCCCISYNKKSGNLDLISLTYFFITLRVHFAIIFEYFHIKFLLPKTFFQRNFLLL